MTAPPELAPVPVHITGTAPGALGAGAVHDTPHKTVYQTITFRTGDLTQPILPASGKRIVAYVQAITDNVVISSNASDAANSVGLTIPAANTAPWPIYDSGPVYASGTAAGQLSVMAVYRK